MTYQPRMSQKESTVLPRQEALETAIGYITSERAQQYGGPEDSFNTIAEFWATWIHARFGVDLDIHAGDVAAMMDLLKSARLALNLGHADSWIDKGGYAGCGYEVTEDLR